MMRTPEERIQDLLEHNNEQLQVIRDQRQVIERLTAMHRNLEVKSAFYDQSIIEVLAKALGHDSKTTEKGSLELAIEAAQALNPKTIQGEKV